MTKPDWFVLMREWVMQNHGDRGVTLPFLVGALAYKENKLQPTMADTRAVLDEMIAKPVDDYVTEIGWCSSLGAPVFTATEGPSRFNSKVGFRHPSKEWLCVVFGHDLQLRWDCSDASTLIGELVEDALGPIADRKYSRDSKEYREFEPWEKKFIEQTIMTK